MKLVCSVLLLSITCSTLGYRSYSGFQVLRTAPLDVSSAEKLAPLLVHPEFDFWSRPHVGCSADIMVGPQHVELLRNSLAGLGLHPTVLVPDLGAVVDKERAEIRRRKQTDKRNPRVLSFDNFMEFDEIMTYLEDVAAAYPEVASIQDIGQSYEGRPMRVLKLSNGPGKTAIFFDAAIHAREWAAPPVALFAINELTENLVVNQAILDKNDFYFLPMANPDGYAYTWSDERFWRKTRSPNAGSSCIGTDPNRNFDWRWGESSTTDECSLQFPGSAPFSEVETRAISDFIASTPSITFYCAIHSYGKFLIYPYGDTVVLPPSNDELLNVATVATEALKAIRGTEYEVGTFANVLYLASGTSQDWAYSRNVSLSYTLELPGGGIGGFDLPPSQILPVVTESWEAIKVFAANIPAASRALPLP